MGELASIKVLAVSDDLAISKLVEATFARAGAQVILAASEREAMHQFNAQCPDLAILDLAMPQLDGLGLCRQMRLRRDTPVILLTDAQSVPQFLRGLNAGATDYVVKPFSPEMLKACACAALHKRVMTTADGSKTNPSA